MDDAALDRDPDVGGANYTTPVPKLGQEEDNDFDPFFRDQRGKIEDMYDSALEQLRSRYQGPQQSDMWLALGSALMRPTEDGSFMSSLANVPEVLLKHRQATRQHSNEMEDLSLKFNLKKASELADLDALALRYRANKDKPTWIRSTDPETGEVVITPVFPDGSVGRNGTPGAGKKGDLPRVASIEEARKLPPGTRFIDPTGVERQVPGGPTPKASGPFRPVSNGRAVIEDLFPGAYVTDNKRDPNSRLGRANPKSWHNRSAGAVDIRPIKGMTFEQYIRGIRDSGYKIIEARDEVTNPSGHATGPHWHVVIGE